MMIPTQFRRLFKYLMKFHGFNLLDRDIPVFPKGFYIGDGKDLVHVTSDMFAKKVKQPPKQRGAPRPAPRPVPPPSKDDDGSF